LDVSPTDAGEVEGAGRYEFEETAVLFAIANDGFVFKNWSSDGVVVSDENPLEIVVVCDTLLTANFVEEDEPIDIEYIITLHSLPEDAGILVGGGTYLENTNVTISATANEGFVFVN